MTWEIKLADERREGREEGREEGRKEGRKEGREEGRKEGRKEGREEGRKEGNILALYELYRDGYITLEKAAVRAGMSEQAFLEVAKKIVEI